MKKLVNLAVLLTFLSLRAFAHDGAHGMKGTVTAITDSTITIETIAKRSETAHFDAKTTFTKSGSTATVKDLRVGDRVVIEAHDMSGKMHAATLRFGKPKKAATSKPAKGADHSSHSTEKK